MNGDRRSPYPIGGTLTGRLSRQPIPAVLPSGEYVVPRRVIPEINIDYGKVEARIMATLETPPQFVENITQAASKYFHAEWRRLDRICVLLASRDPRRVKRGKRLFRRFRETRLGSLTLYWKD